MEANVFGSWVLDMAQMHEKFGVGIVVDNMSKEYKLALLKFRLDFLYEELKESYAAAGYDFEATIKQVKQATELTLADAEEVVDGLIDLCVVAIGTLDLLHVDAQKAWNEVFIANTAKEVGIKASRPNSLGLPDLIKPAGWTAPSHKGNYGLLAGMFGTEHRTCIEVK